MSLGHASGRPQSKPVKKVIFYNNFVIDCKLFRHNCLVHRQHDNRDREVVEKISKKRVGVQASGRTTEATNALF